MLRLKACSVADTPAQIPLRRASASARPTSAGGAGAATDVNNTGCVRPWPALTLKPEWPSDENAILHRRESRWLHSHVR
jgi:hypothetical protein